MNINHFFRDLDAMFRTKNIQEVEAFILDCLEQAKETEDVPSILAISNELGGIYRVTSRFEEGKAVYALALEAIKLLGLENSEQHGTTLLNLASLQGEHGNLEEALKLYKQVASMYQTAGLDQDYRMAALYNNISHVYDQLNQDGEALRYAEQSLSAIQELPDYEVELATTHTTVALRLLKLKRLAEAEEHLKKAESIFLNLAGKTDVHYSATLNALGEIAYYRCDYGSAAEYFEKSLRIIRENYGENKAYKEVSKNLDTVREKMGTRKTGMELAESFYQEQGHRMIREKFPEYEKYMAIGLVGEGSECLGMDDHLSEDHDFGAGFCIWLPEEIYLQIGDRLQEEYDRLEKPDNGLYGMETPDGKGRTGVFSLERFYKKYTGCPGGPQTNLEWLFSPEVSLSTVTNGKVFQDKWGTFTQIRNELLDFYPRDVYLKKLAARMASMSQAGQYNYERCMKREDRGAAFMACGEFVKATGSMVYLLNKKYMPFYKWMFMGMTGMEKLAEVKGMLETLISIPDTTENMNRKIAAIEEICVQVREELGKQGIIDGRDDFLAHHCQHVMNSIQDTQIRNLPILFDGK